MADLRSHPPVDVLLREIYERTSWVLELSLRRHGSLSDSMAPFVRSDSVCTFRRCEKGENGVVEGGG